VKYAFIKENEQYHGVRRMCSVLGVSRGGYYGWQRRPLSKRSVRDDNLAVEIRKVHKESGENYGAIKTWKALKARGVDCGRNRVARLRKAHGIASRRRKRFKITTMSKHTQWIAPNRLGRCFQVSQPNKVWVGDVTFVATRSGWLYLAVLLDLYSRKVIGWSMSERNNKELVRDALDMALERRRPKSRILHHTDRGSIYGSDDYRNKLVASGLEPSMSRHGDCYDNAVAESFFSTLKNELMCGRLFESRYHARTEIFKYIEIYYNRQRLHQSLGYVTPDAMELEAVA